MRVSACAAACQTDVRLAYSQVLTRRLVVQQ
jgi:hypothetical protein